jgi:hypothetical protein
VIKILKKMIKDNKILNREELEEDQEKLKYLMMILYLAPIKTRNLIQKIIAKNLLIIRQLEVEFDLNDHHN